MKPVFAALLSIVMISNSLAQLPDYLPQDGLVAWYPFNGNANDESGVGFNGTAIGASLATDRNGNPNSSYYFDWAGVTGYGSAWHRVELAPTFSDAIGTDLTISAWVNLENYWWPTNSIHTAMIAGSAARCAESMNFRFKVKEQGALALNFGTDFVTTAEGAIQLNTWYHVAATVSTDSLRLFINGDQVASAVSSSFDMTGCLTLGEHHQGNGHWYYWDGYIDDVSIHSRALSPSEIEGVYLETEIISGCIDNGACNYDSEATTDDGSCAYAPSILQSGVAIGDTIFTDLNNSISLSSGTAIEMDSILLDEFSVSFNVYSAHSLPVSELSKQYRLIATGRYGYADGWSHVDAAFDYKWDVDTGTKVNCNGTQDAQESIVWLYDGNTNFQRPDNNVDNNDLFCSGVDKTYYWTIDGDGNSHTVGFLDGGGYGDNSGSLDFSFYELIPANLVTWPDGSVDSTWTYPAALSGTFNLSATQNGCSTNFVVVVGEPGCMDSTACNYSLTATYDDGSCVAAGCTDATACNYDAAAGCDDGSCAPAGAAEGCTDSSACNYDATLVCDDGSCVYPPLGISDCNAGATLCGAGTTFNVATQQCLPTASSPSSSSCLTCEDLIEEEQVGNRFYRSIDTEEILEQCDDN